MAILGSFFTTTAQYAHKSDFTASYSIQSCLCAACKEDSIFGDRRRFHISTVHCGASLEVALEVLLFFIATCDCKSLWRNIRNSVWGFTKDFSSQLLTLPSELLYLYQFSLVFLFRAWTTLSISTPVHSILDTNTYTVNLSKRSWCFLLVLFFVFISH